MVRVNTCRIEEDRTPVLSSLRSVDAGSVRAVPKDWASYSASRRWWKPAYEERGTHLPSSSGDRAGSGLRYRADEWTDGIRGVVAQLGEHLHGMQGVGGSSPPSSTTFSIGQSQVVPRSVKAPSS